jgi:hypothetical protein
VNIELSSELKEVIKTNLESIKEDMKPKLELIYEEIIIK